MSALQASPSTSSPAPSARVQCTHQLSEVMALLGQRFVTYFPTLSRITGSPKAALMLGHALYVTRELVLKSPERDGWFWKTREDWLAATGLTPREQASARTTLLEQGLMREARLGMPCRLHYRLDLEVLARTLQRAAGAATAWDWNDQVMRMLLGAAHSCYAPLAAVAGSAVGGIYLSRLVNATRHALKAATLRADGFIEATDLYLERMALSERQVRTAREHLVSLGLLAIKRSTALHGRQLVRLDLARLAEMLCGTTSPTPLLTKTHNRRGVRERVTHDEDAQQLLTFSHNHSCQNRTTTHDENAQLLLTKTHNNSCRKRTSSCAETSEVLGVVYI